MDTYGEVKINGWTIEFDYWIYLWSECDIARININVIMEGHEFKSILSSWGLCTMFIILRLLLTCLSSYVEENNYDKKIGTYLDNVSLIP